MIARLQVLDDLEHVVVIADAAVARLIDKRQPETTCEKPLAGARVNRAMALECAHRSVVQDSENAATAGENDDVGERRVRMHVEKALHDPAGREVDHHLRRARSGDVECGGVGRCRRENSSYSEGKGDNSPASAQHERPPKHFVMSAGLVCAACTGPSGGPIRALAVRVGRQVPRFLDAYVTVYRNCRGRANRIVATCDMGTTTSANASCVITLSFPDGAMRRPPRLSESRSQSLMLRADEVIQ